MYTKKDIEKVFLPRSLYHYTQRIFSITDPATEYKDNWHIGAIAEYLTACKQRQIKRLIINIPPRHMKTLNATISFPTWEWLTNPASRFIFVTYADSLGLKSAYYRRDIINSEFYQSIKKINLKTEKIKEVINDSNGYFYTTSTGGTLTGYGGNYIIIDDPINPKNSMSEVLRKSCNDWYRNTLVTRLDNKENDVIIIIMQRLHEDDLVGDILSRDNNFEQLCLQGISDNTRKIILPLSYKEIEIKKDDVLWPNHESRELLLSMKKEMGTYTFEAQYQQQPSPSSGGYVKLNWFNFYNPRDLPKIDFKCLSVDCAFKATKDSDEVAIQIWGNKGNAYYLIYTFSDKIGFIDTLKQIMVAEKLYNPNSELIEDKANGSAVIEVFKSKLKALKAITPTESKEARLHAITPMVEAGNIYLPCNADYKTIHEYNNKKEKTKSDLDKLLINKEIIKLIDQLIKFPKAKHDDMVDAMSQALNYMRIHGDINLDKFVLSKKETDI